MALFSIVILIVSIALILFALLAIVLFKRKRRLGGSIFAVLALFFVLVDMKAMQFRKMTLTRTKCLRPPWPARR